MGGTKEMIDVGEGRFRQRAHRVTRHDENLLAHDALDLHALRGDFSVGRSIRAQREERRVLVGRRRVGGEGRVHGDYPYV